MPSHYLNQCWNIVNWTHENKLQQDLNRNSYIFILENALENVGWKMEAILSQPQSVKACPVWVNLTILHATYELYIMAYPLAICLCVMAVKVRWYQHKILQFVVKVLCVCCTLRCAQQDSFHVTWPLGFYWCPVSTCRVDCFTVSLHSPNGRLEMSKGLPVAFGK